MSLKDSMPLTLNDVKPHCRIEETDNTENAVLQDYLDAAFSKADKTLNRGWDPGMVPAEIQLAVKQLVAYYYENRGDTSTTPEHIEKVLNEYRFLPGM